MTENNVVPLTTAVSLPGLDQVAPGIAYQIQAAHDAAVGALEVLLAESRQDADRTAEVSLSYRLRADALGAELRAAAPIVDAARELVAAWDGLGLVQPSRLRQKLTDAVRADLERRGL